MDIWQLVLRQPGICFIEGEEGNQGGGAGSEGGGAGASDSGEGGGEGGAGEQAAKPEPLTKDSIALLVSEQLKPLHEKIGELTSENVNLRAAVRTRGQEQQPREVKPEVVEPKLPSKDEFLAAMNTDPVGTLKQIIDQLTDPKIESRVSRATSGVRQESEARDAFMRDAEGDRTSALSVSVAFGNETPQDPEYAGSLREEFDKMGDKELRAIAATRGGRYQVGDLELAANRAERRMRAAGKLPGANGNGNGNGNREVPRSFPRNNPRSSSGAGGGSGNGAGDSGPIKTIDDLVAKGKMNKDEAEGARKNNKKWGLTEEDFIKNWLASEQDNPRFGTGA